MCPVRFVTHVPGRSASKRVIQPATVSRGRGAAGEAAVLADEVRLVGVAAGGGDVGPVGRAVRPRGPRRGGSAGCGRAASGSGRSRRGSGRRGACGPAEAVGEGLDANPAVGAVEQAPGGGGRRGPPASSSARAAAIRRGGPGLGDGEPRRRRAAVGEAVGQVVEGEGVERRRGGRRRRPSAGARARRAPRRRQVDLDAGGAAGRSRWRRCRHGGRRRSSRSGPQGRAARSKAMRKSPEQQTMIGMSSEAGWTASGIGPGVTIVVDRRDEGRERRRGRRVRRAGPSLLLDEDLVALLADRGEHRDDEGEDGEGEERRRRSGGAGRSSGRRARGSSRGGGAPRAAGRGRSRGGAAPARSRA